jgi:hypothetical protein
MGFYPHPALDPIPVEFFRMPDIIVAVRHDVFHVVAAQLEVKGWMNVGCGIRYELAID